ncbi:methyltransferase domain-containing protein [Candidatus Bathyarchaeota archaeon]|nr:methyltransferase domain-containing protein [Candidatus Bathyarchaeota archaeon]
MGTSSIKRVHKRGAGLLGVTVWGEVVGALEQIIEEYERVNHVISWFQDDRTRLIGLNKIGCSEGAALELGSGPGNYSRMISRFHDGDLICLDFSDKMLMASRHRNKDLGSHYVRGVFEALPIRNGSMGFVTSAYALRDSLYKPLVIKDACDALASGGRFLLIDVGKPDNRIVRGFMSFYLRYLVPVMGGLTAGHGYRNPWSKLYNTFEELPPNRSLKAIVEGHLVDVEKVEIVLGAFLIIWGIKPADRM